MQGQVEAPGADEPSVENSSTHRERPKLLDVNRRTWKRFHQPNVALPFVAMAFCASAAARPRALRCTTGSVPIILIPRAPAFTAKPAFKPERSAAHDANPQMVDAK